ncbi:MAG: DUF502 domain-containing protein [Candidatus Liberibacter ctenarytainae]|uniref:DUF502 domain-containing protein n=1 Tax=Candidatus Liberibacter ctenarytainae TaxID=2020335 RepID=A0A937DMB6_9HYPH|nr:DUF502 domain-containing protein [Candidatus Liberibacter ctenarytainae]
MQKRSFRSSFAMKIRNNFLTGLVICAPLAITIWLTLSLIHWIDSFVIPYLPDRYNPEYYVDFSIPGMGLFIVIILVNIIGFTGRNLLGRFLLSLSETVLNHTPIVRSLYRSTKQIVQTILNEHTTPFKNTCIIEYPSPGHWSLCFLTTDVQGELKEKFSERNSHDMVTVFIPPTPLPTAGMLVFVSRKKVIMLDMTAEDAIKMLVSGGLIVPEQISPDEKNKKNKTE